MDWVQQQGEVDKQWTGVAAGTAYRVGVRYVELVLEKCAESIDSQISALAKEVELFPDGVDTALLQQAIQSASVPVSRSGQYFAQCVPTAEFSISDISRAEAGVPFTS